MRFTIQTLTVLLIAAPSLAVPESAAGQAVQPTCPPEAAAMFPDVELTDHILTRQTTELPAVSRVEAEDLAEVAVPALDPAPARPLPRHGWQSDADRAQLAEGTLTVQQAFAEPEDGRRLIPR